jgi:hypothetical protein
MEDEYVDAHDAPPHQQQQQQPVNLKIPPFWASNPEAWFGIVEGQFILRNITQDNLRFYASTTCLEPCLNQLYSAWAN